MFVYKGVEYLIVYKFKIKAHYTYFRYVLSQFYSWNCSWCCVWNYFSPVLSCSCLHMSDLLLPETENRTGKPCMEVWAQQLPCLQHKLSNKYNFSFHTVFWQTSLVTLIDPWNTKILTCNLPLKCQIYYFRVMFRHKFMHNTIAKAFDGLHSKNRKCLSLQHYSFAIKATLLCVKNLHCELCIPVHTCRCYFWRLSPRRK